MTNAKTRVAILARKKVSISRLNLMLDFNVRIQILHISFANMLVM